MKVFNRNLFVLLFISIMCFQVVHAGEARKRISSIEHDFSNISDIEAEIRFGRDLAARILGNYPLLKDEKINKYVGLIGTGISQYAGRPELKFYFGVLESDEINAFATPGGYVFITYGALLQMENEAQLAGVLGHEIAHIIKKHVIKKLKIKGDDGSAVGGIANLIGGTTGSFREAFEQSLDKAEEILFKKGYEIEEEIEADQIGILLASTSGYEPNALREFLIKCKSFESGNQETKSEYPPHEIRIKKINNIINTEGLMNLTQIKKRNRFHAYIQKSNP